MAKPRRPCRLTWSRAAAVAAAALAPVIPGRASAQCAHYDLFVGDGVDEAVVADLRGRLTAADLMGAGDLADCPVRLSAAGEHLVVDIELEDGIVSRVFPREPPGEAAWSVARLLQGLSPRAGATPGAGPPDEILPTVMLPRAREAPASPPSRPTPAPIVLATSVSVHVEVFGSAEPISLSFQGSPYVAFLPEWLRPTLLVDWYVRGRSSSRSGRSGQAGVGLAAEGRLTDRLRLGLTAAFIPVRYEREWLGPGTTLSCRLEDAFTPWLAMGPRIATTWLAGPRAEVGAGFEVVVRP